MTTPREIIARGLLADQHYTANDADECAGDLLDMLAAAGFRIIEGDTAIPFRHRSGGHWQVISEGNTINATWISDGAI